MAQHENPADPTHTAEVIRETAERSVDEARKAFDTMMDVAQRTVSGLDANGAEAQDHFRAMTRDTIAFATESAEAAFSFLSELARARTPDEITVIQKSFIDEQMERLGRQTRTLGDEAIRAARDLTKPFER